MSQVVNLNKIRKDRDKAARRIQAAENRVTFGLSKSAKTLAAHDKDKASRDLDGHKRGD